jgi:ssDNA-binding replication factor A large subunit
LKTEAQDIILSDPTGAAKMTLWPPYIGSLQKGHSYHFSNVAVNEFNDKKYLAYSQNASKHPIDTIPEVMPPPSEQEQEAHDCEIIAVTNLK